jgi:soluble lytic murein transglycosylase
VTRAASRIGVDPYLLAAVIREESRFDPQALSGAGAYGLMQLMPETARTAAGSLGLLPPDRGALADPGTNVLLGAAVLKGELVRFGRLDLALAAYNAGPGAVRRWLRERAAPDQDSFIESVPYPETRAYVKAVLRSWGIYRWLYREGHPSP